MTARNFVWPTPDYRKKARAGFLVAAVAFIVVWGFFVLPGFWQSPHPARTCASYPCTTIRSTQYYFGLGVATALWLGIAAMWLALAWLATWSLRKWPPASGRTP